MAGGVRLLRGGVHGPGRYGKGGDGGRPGGAGAGGGPAGEGRTEGGRVPARVRACVGSDQTQVGEWALGKFYRQKEVNVAREMDDGDALAVGWDRREMRAREVGR